MIATSLMCNQELVIADEPATALDVTIQARILDLMKSLRERFYTSVILITNDLSVMADVCDRVAVMYGGLIVETGADRDIFYNSKHPYAWRLMRSVPNPKTDKTETKEKLAPIQGRPPDLFKPPPGFSFNPRCDYAMKICGLRQPPLYEVSGGHQAACFLNRPDAPDSPARQGGKGRAYERSAGDPA